VGPALVISLTQIVEEQEEDRAGVSL